MNMQFYCLYYEDFKPSHNPTKCGKVKLAEDMRKGVFIVSPSLQLLTKLAEPFGILAQNYETRYNLTDQLFQPATIHAQGAIIADTGRIWTSQSQKARRAWRLKTAMEKVKAQFKNVVFYQPHELSDSPDLDQFAVEANFREAGKEAVGIACFVHPGPKDLIRNHFCYFVISGVEDDVVLAASLPAKRIDSLLNQWLIHGMQGVPEDTPRKIVRALQRLDAPAQFSEHKTFYAADRRCMTNVVKYIEENGLRVSRDAITAQLDHPIFAGLRGGEE